MFSYSVVEGALAEFFDVRPKAQPALRSRIRHLQRLGLMPDKSGNRLVYTKYDVYDLALALSIADFGVAPQFIIESGIPKLIRDIVNNGKWKKGPWACIYNPSSLSERSAPNLRFVLLSDAPKLIKEIARIAFINLEDLTLRMDKILED